jgi:phosphotriesterase-related protein
MAILDVLVKAGARPERIIIGHLDLFHDPKVFKDISQAGCYLEWDIFGYEDTSWEGLGVHELVLFASDVERMERLERLIADGYGDRLVVAQDVCLHMHQRKYGGKGYAHILENIVPRMRKRGFTEKHINSILVDNPKRILTFE